MVMSAMWLDWCPLIIMLAVITLQACCCNQQARHHFVVRHGRMGQLATRTLCAVLHKAFIFGTNLYLLCEDGISRVWEDHAFREHWMIGIVLFDGIAGNAGSQGLRRSKTAVNTAKSHRLNQIPVFPSFAALCAVVTLCSSASAAHAASDYAPCTSAAFVISPICDYIPTFNGSAAQSLMACRDTFYTAYRPLPWAFDLTAPESLHFSGQDHSCNAEVAEANKPLSSDTLHPEHITSSLTVAERGDMSKLHQPLRSFQGSTWQHDLLILLYVYSSMIPVAYVVAVMHILGWFPPGGERQHAADHNPRRHRPRRHSQHAVHVRMPGTARCHPHQRQLEKEEEEDEVGNELFLIYALCQPVMAVVFWALRLCIHCILRVYGIYTFMRYIYRHSSRVPKMPPKNALAVALKRMEHLPMFVYKTIPGVAIQGGCAEGELVLVIGSLSRPLPTHLLDKVASLPHCPGTLPLHMCATLEAGPGFPETVQQEPTGQHCSHRVGAEAAHQANEEDRTLPAAEQNPVQDVQGLLTAVSSTPRGGQSLQMALEGSPARTKLRNVPGSPAVKPTPFAADMATDTAEPASLTADLASPAAFPPVTAQQACAADLARAATPLVSNATGANANVQPVSAFQELSLQVPANQQQTIHKDHVQVQAAGSRVKMMHGNIQAIDCDATTAASGIRAPAALHSNVSAQTSVKCGCTAQNLQGNKKRNRWLSKFLCCAKSSKVRD